MRWTIPAITLLTTACAASGPMFSSSLTAVQRPTDVQQRWGEHAIVPVETGHRFSDDLIDAVVYVGRTGVWMDIENLTDHSMQIVWDEAAFVANGRSDGVVSGETKFVDIGRSQPPTVIPAKSFVSVVAFPRSQADAVNAKIHPFTRQPLTTTVETRLVLPLKVQDVVNPYTFVFEFGPPTPDGA
jgi:hypothetical protein